MLMNPDRGAIDHLHVALVQLDVAARSKRVSRAAIVEAALASFLAADSAERLEPTINRRLDRITRQFNRLQWHVDRSN